MNLDPRQELLHVSPHLRHVWRLSTPLGMFEHCRLARPRPEHGFCTDDSARLLVMASRNHLDATTRRLADRALCFLEQAYRGRGRFANRRRVDGVWLDDGGGIECDDAAGRALWGLGTAVAQCADHGVAERARRLFAEAADFRSSSLRSTAFAVLGACEVLGVEPDNVVARAAVADALEVWAPRCTAGAGAWRRRWPWPESRLSYANAVIPHMLIVGGAAIGDDAARSAGIALLHWLADVETGAHDWLSVTPTRGRGLGDVRPAFDQQPIEVATLADAAVAASAVDDDRRWDELIVMCGEWFVGRNDVGVAMLDWGTGGGFDGLTPSGPNLNQGAESTLAALTTMQHVRQRMASV